MRVRAAAQQPSARQVTRLLLTFCLVVSAALLADCSSPSRDGSEASLTQPPQDTPRGFARPGEVPEVQRDAEEAGTHSVQSLDAEAVDSNTRQDYMAGIEIDVEGQQLASHQEALQLLKPNKEHTGFEVDPTALAALQEVEEPVAVVAAVGPYHGGKSFLLNVLLNSTHGFPVGTRPEPETLGVWMRIIPPDLLRAPDGSRVVLLDTEGFYGALASRSYDAKVFAVACLLSSHLVYNTLRTLGDASSVSALAGLAKHAHVFNMHNWLHSGEGSDTQPLQEAAPEPRFLLQTLDFPPLTWVVQGFDIELPPSQSPKDYLQIYLKAYAQTGDRSLEEIFTKGVECMPMRTPTDLNKLREDVGGGGLGEQAELFPMLHPAYKADVQHVRDAVMGRLQAKGKPALTGKAVAALLPLLVHFVNADFPFSAERPVAETVRQLLLDSGLEGGTAFFKNIMQHALQMPGRTWTSMEGRRAGGKTEQGVADTEALVKGARTQQELEALMDKAGDSAVRYCERRCVGVPAELRAPVCTAALLVRLNHVKPAFRAENEQRASEILLALARGFQVAAGNQLAAIQLPQPEQELEATCSRLLKTTLQTYDSKVGKHKGGPVYGQARTRLAAQVQAKAAEVLAANTQQIASLLSQGQRAFRETYNNAIRREGVDVERTGRSGGSEAGRQAGPLSVKKLQQLHQEAAQEAERRFAHAVAEGALPWVRGGHRQFEFHKFENQEWVQQRYSDLQAANEAQVAALCQEHAREQLQHFHTGLRQLAPFPDNDEALAAKMDDLAKHALAKYTAAVAEYAGVAVVEDGRRQVARTLDLARADVEEKNTRLMTALCYEPLQAAKMQLQMHDCARTRRNMFGTLSWWSPRCLLPGPRLLFGFQHAAYTAARQQLDRAQLSFKTSGLPAGTASGLQEHGQLTALSPATRNKVILSWIEHDLSGFSLTVATNFALLATLVSVLLGSLWWVSSSATAMWRGAGPPRGSRTGAWGGSSGEPPVWRPGLYSVPEERASAGRTDGGRRFLYDGARGSGSAS